MAQITLTKNYIKNAMTDIPGLKPGDTIIVDKNFNSIYINGLKGLPDARIKLLAINGTKVSGVDARSAKLEIDNSEYVDIDGFVIEGIPDSTRPGKYTTMGIKLYFNSNISVKNCTVTGATLGLQLKNDAIAGNTSTYFDPNIGKTTIDNIVLDNIKVYNTNNEGFYIGNTAPVVGTLFNSPIKGATITNLYAENTGWDGFQITNAQDVIASNISVKNTGIAFSEDPTKAQYSGITIQDAVTGTFTNLSVDGSQAAGLMLFAAGDTIVSNVTLNNVAQQAVKAAIQVDNRSTINRGITLPAKKLDLENVTITGTSKAKYAMYVYNTSNSNTLASIPGTVLNLNFDKSVFTSGVQDTVGNDYIGGTIGRVIVPPTPPVPTKNLVYTITNKVYDDGSLDSSIEKA